MFAEGRSNKTVAQLYIFYREKNNCVDNRQISKFHFKIDKRLQVF